MQRHHTTGSTESFQTARSPPSSPRPGIPEPELTTQRLSSQTAPRGSDRRHSVRHRTPHSQRPLSQNTLIGSDRLSSITFSMPGEPPIIIREDGFITFEHNPADPGPSSPIRSIRCSMPGVPPRLIREDGFVMFENSNPTDSGPRTPIPSSPRLRPRTPSLSGSDFSDRSSIYYHRRPYNYTPPRGYITDVLYAIMIITAFIMGFLPFFVEDIPMGFQLVTTAILISLLASYGMLIGWEVGPDREPAWYEEWRY
ncbi:hypothetical protein VF21_04540 [Pseudogymnoascus sp. 05NY08]|nr:hypothetical protein VF21_04540 [Pseudogymnoascus sp. 05NY08]